MLDVVFRQESLSPDHTSHRNELGEEHCPASSNAAPAPVADGRGLSFTAPHPKAPRPGAAAAGLTERARERSRRATDYVVASVSRADLGHPNRSGCLIRSI